MCERWYTSHFILECVYIIAQVKVGYCTSGQIYFNEPKASKNASHECNINHKLYTTFTNAIMCLLPTSPRKSVQCIFNSR